MRKVARKQGGPRDGRPVYGLSNKERICRDQRGRSRNDALRAEPAGERTRTGNEPTRVEHVDISTNNEIRGSNQNTTVNDPEQRDLLRHYEGKRKARTGGGAVGPTGTEKKRRGGEGRNSGHRDMSSCQLGGPLRKRPFQGSKGSGNRQKEKRGDLTGKNILRRVDATQSISGVFSGRTTAMIMAPAKAGRSNLTEASGVRSATTPSA